MEVHIFIKICQKILKIFIILLNVLIHLYVIFGKILIGIIVVVVAFIAYVGWVNSGANDGNFFGMAFRLPLESKDHYCWRKSDRVFTVDSSAYKKCMAEE